MRQLEKDGGLWEPHCPLLFRVSPRTALDWQCRQGKKQYHDRSMGEKGLERKLQINNADGKEIPGQILYEVI